MSSSLSLDPSKPQTATISTNVPNEFLELAKKYRMTPEYLLRLVASDLSANPPPEIRILSASPLGGQACADCSLRERCSSALIRARDRLICFENLSFIPLLAAAAIAWFALWHSTRHHAARQAPAPLNIATPEPMHESSPPEMPETYRKAAPATMIAKKRKRKTMQNKNPIVVAWNEIVKAGYRNARQSGR